jgi:hypothetical protein
MKVIGVIVGALIAVFALSVVLAIPVMLLWDWLMPTIFGLKEITLMQAWGLTLLTGILFRPGHTSTNS